MTNRLNALLDLPWAGIVTTNYDNTIMGYLAAIKRPWTNVCNKPSDSLGQVLKSSKRPFLIHLHGSVGSQSMVLCEEDYDDTYLGSSVVASFLKALILRYTLVFIGTQVEDRFVELKRELQLIFGDKGARVGRPPLSPEYALLAKTDKNRGTYLESTEGFSVIWYDNKTGNHEGLVDCLQALAEAVGNDDLDGDGKDKISKQLLSIVKSAPSGQTVGQIVKAFWSNRTVNIAYSDLNNRELYYRLRFLAYKGLLSYDEQYKLFRPL